MINVYDILGSYFRSLDFFNYYNVVNNPNNLKDINAVVILPDIYIKLCNNQDIAFDVLTKNTSDISKLLNELQGTFNNFNSVKYVYEEEEYYIFLKVMDDVITAVNIDNNTNQYTVGCSIMITKRR